MTMTSSQQRKHAMHEPLPLRNCSLCGRQFQPWRRNHVYCGPACRDLTTSPPKLAEHLRRVYAMLADKGVLAEEIRELVSS
jgi:hypothetical protein